jgi:uncharacterized protein (DUF1697 family)
MIKYLALLRGINVSGHNMIKMDALKKMLENMGFQNVETYIQSGNVFLESEEENAVGIGFIIMVAKSDLELCFKNNPFLKEKECDIKKLYVAFISKEFTSTAINDLKISNFKPDEVTIDSNRIYIKYAIGAGKTNLDQKYIEKKLNVVATMRNWNTVT